MAGDETERIETEGPTLHSFSPGRQVFGRHILEAIAGRGGMGVVWRARDEALERIMALKFLPEVVAADHEAVRDLKRETKRCLELAHPHIVRVYDFVQDVTSAAIAMEYIDGESLAKRKSVSPGGCLAAAELAPRVSHLCLALDYAHSKARIVHRDLKPANLLVTRHGDLKVSDFGISHSLTETRTRLTNERGGTTGTLFYMSPQQLAGDKPTEADDIYALGATLYELLTGKPPFYRGDAYSLMKQIGERRPAPLATHRADAECEGAEIPPRWSEAILACLEKDPMRRPRSAVEVAARLGLFEAARPLAEGLSGDETVKIVTPKAVTPNESTGIEVFSAQESDAATAPRKSTVDSEPRARPESPAESVLLTRSRAPRWIAAAGVIALATAGWWYFGPNGQKPARQLEKTRAPDAVPAAVSATPETPRTAEAGQPRTIPELGLTLMPIAPGTYMMGSAENEEGRLANEGRQTQVTLTQPYWLGKTEVTQAEWTAIMENKQSNFFGKTLPVEQVSWDDAMEFCRRLTERERKADRLPEGYEYTLPTEAQWEYACRAGTTGPYAGNLDEMGWYMSNSGKTTHAVGTKKANAWGLADMAGNVAEWCADWHADDLPGGTVRDFAGPASGSERVVRGGGWTDAVFCRSAMRSSGVPFWVYDNVGFRVALRTVR